MKLVLRIDDLGQTPEHGPNPPKKAYDPSLIIARELHAALGGVPYLGAVVPAGLNAEGIAWLDCARSEGMVVAIHGWDHAADRPIFAEFADRTEGECRERLEQAVRVVGPTKHLVPPYNEITMEMIGACWGLIEWIWATPAAIPGVSTYGGPVHVIEVDEAFYGATNQKQGTALASLLDVFDAVDLNEPGTGIVTLHLTWEYGFDETFSGVQRLMQKIGHLLISPDEYVRGLEYEVRPR